MSTRDDKGEGRAFIEHPTQSDEKAGPHSTSLREVPLRSPGFPVELGAFGQLYAFLSGRRTRGRCRQCGRKSGSTSRDKFFS